MLLSYTTAFAGRASLATGFALVFREAGKRSSGADASFKKK
jgi:hypothetical protein